MINFYFKKIFPAAVSLLIFLWTVLPSSALAARVYLETSTNPIHVGDTVVVNVKIDSENTTLNVVEGDINMGEALSLLKIEELSIAGSVLSLWPKSPVLSPDTKAISFTGGVPNGFNSSDATLFKIIVSAHQSGILNIKPGHIAAYLNDGKGTLAQVKSSGLDLKIEEAVAGSTPRNEWTDDKAGNNQEIVYHTAALSPYKIISILVVVVLLVGVYLFRKFSKRNSKK